MVSDSAPVPAESAPPAHEGVEEESPASPDASGPVPGATSSDSEPPEATTPAPPVARGILPPSAGVGGPRRPTRYGLAIDFEHLPESPDLGRLVESTVLVNTAHPAYARAVASRSEGYHGAVSRGPERGHSLIASLVSGGGRSARVAVVLSR